MTTTGNNPPHGCLSRSENMRHIRSKDTAPEIAVRQLLRQLGYTGYRIHYKKLPGKPDVVFIGRKKAVFVHGCFWHGHDCKEGIRKPKSNRDYWLLKIEQNRQRDAQHLTDLNRLGWSTLTIWECELADLDRLTEVLLTFLKSS